MDCGQGHCNVSSASEGIGRGAARGPFHRGLIAFQTTSIRELQMSSFICLGSTIGPICCIYSGGSPARPRPPPPSLPSLPLSAGPKLKTHQNVIQEQFGCELLRRGSVGIKAPRHFTHGPEPGEPGHRQP